MKRLIMLCLLTTLCLTTGFAKSKSKDLSGPIAVRGELKKAYEGTPAGTQVIIRRVMKIAPQGSESTIRYAVEINGVQTSIPIEKIDIIKLAPPQNDEEFWQGINLTRHFYERPNNRENYSRLRREIDEECMDYLDKLEEISYRDDYLTSYVQGVFAKLNSINLDEGLQEQLNVRVIQSPEPTAFMLPNGSMVVGTGLLCTLDSEDELAAVIACELGHFIFDHQVDNVRRAERRAKRAAFWADVFAGVAEGALDVAYWNDNERAYDISFVADIASIVSLLSIPAVDRLGMKYKAGQEFAADALACELLAYKGYNPDGLSSALGKIRNYYRQQRQEEDITRYGNIAQIDKRIEKTGQKEVASRRPYLRMTSDVVTFNAGMNLANKRYKEVTRLIDKNIENGLATDHDYILSVKARMALANTEEENQRCLSLLNKAEELAGNSPNLDIQKQRILLLMRMNKQMQAVDVLHEYLELLSTYQQQGIEGEEKEWANRETEWASRLLEKIGRI